MIHQASFGYLLFNERFDKQLTAQDSRFYFNYQDTAADTFDKIDPRELNENAAVMAVLAYALADSASPAPR
jgi:hypothetical protein